TEQLDKMVDSGLLGWQKGEPPAPDDDYRSLYRYVSPLLWGLPWALCPPKNVPVPGDTAFSVALYIHPQNRAGNFAKAIEEDDTLAGANITKHWAVLMARTMEEDYNKNWRSKGVSTLNYIAVAISHEIGWHLIGQGKGHKSKKSAFIDNESLLEPFPSGFSPDAKVDILRGLKIP